MNLNKLLDKYDTMDHLECDGLTRILHWVLRRNGTLHTVVYGMLQGKAGSVSHYWIKLPQGQTIDYRARIWMGKDAPHGIFNVKDQSEVEYIEIDEYLMWPSTNSFVIRILGVDPDTLEIL
jgi:hypothetical protein